MLSLDFQDLFRVGPLVTDGPTTAYSERFPFLIRQRITPRAKTLVSEVMSPLNASRTLSLVCW